MRPDLTVMRPEALCDTSISAFRHLPSGNASVRSASKIYDAGYEASVAALRDALGERDFESAWAEDAALSTDEAIAYARRGAAAANANDRPAVGHRSPPPRALSRCRARGNWENP